MSLRPPAREDLRVLARNRRFLRLLAVQGLSQASDGLYQIAVAAVVIFEVSAAQTPAQVTKVLAVTLLPFSLVGPFTGPFIDRFSRRSILVGTSAVRTGLILLLLPAVSWPEPVLLALAVAAVSVNRFYHATKNAVMPMVVPPEHYLGANAVSSTAGMVFALGGAVIGGPLTDAVSPRLPILLAAVCTVGSAVAAAGLVLPHGERRGLAGIVRQLRDNAGSTGFAVRLAAVGGGGFVGAILVAGVARRVGRPGVATVAFVLAGVA